MYRVAGEQRNVFFAGGCLERLGKVKTKLGVSHLNWEDGNDVFLRFSPEFRSAQDRGGIQTYSDVGTLPGFLGGVILPERGPPLTRAPCSFCQEPLLRAWLCNTATRTMSSESAHWASSSSLSLMNSVSLVRVLSLSWICFLSINWGQQQCLIHRTLVKM